MDTGHNTKLGNEITVAGTYRVSQGTCRVGDFVVNIPDIQRLWARNPLQTRRQRAELEMTLSQEDVIGLFDDARRRSIKLHKEKLISERKEQPGHAASPLHSSHAPPCPPSPKQLDQEDAEFSPLPTPSECASMSKTPAGESQKLKRKRPRRWSINSKAMTEAKKPEKRQKKTQRRAHHRSDAAPSDSVHEPSAKVVRDAISSIATPIATDVEPESTAHVQSTGFEGRNEEPDTKLYTLDELLADGFTLIPWNGRDVIPITDPSGRILVTLLGQLACSDSEVVLAGAVAALEKARDSLIQLGKPRPYNRRGEYWSVKAGISHGGGSEEPHNFAFDSEQEAIIVAELLADKNIRRINGFVSNGFRIYSPKLHALYLTVGEAITDRNSKLKFPFNNAIFPACTFNLGPNTVLFKHLDKPNLAFGSCAVTCAGPFDPKKGGHLILFDLKYVIEFPSGSTILLPSAVFRHGNVPIQRGETRMSIVQYAAAGLFRWARSGFCRARDRGSATVDAMAKEAPDRYINGLEYYSRMSELRK